MQRTRCWKLQAGDMNTFFSATSILPVERRNSRFVSLRVSKFISSVTFRAVRARPLKKLCLLVWLKTDLLKFIDLWKPGLAESIYNYRPCSRWGLAPQPSTTGSPRLSAPGWPVPKELQRNSHRFIKLTCHVKANSNNLLLKYYINIFPPYSQTQSSTIACRLGRWQSNKHLESNEKEFPRAGLRAE